MLPLKKGIKCLPTEWTFLIQQKYGKGKKDEGKLLGNVRTTLRQFWENFEITLRQLWYNLRTTLGPHGAHLVTSIPLLCGWVVYGHFQISSSRHMREKRAYFRKSVVLKFHNKVLKTLPMAIMASCLLRQLHVFLLVIQCILWTQCLHVVKYTT